MNPVYLDCNATTPIEPEVAEILARYLVEEYGNEGSRTHEFGARAKQAVQNAREQVASVAQAKRDEVIFTSGATESNNLAILGLAEAADNQGRKHVISTQIEHKAVLEPLQELERRGFEVTYLRPSPDGWIDPQEISGLLRPETFLVSVMQANNETGVVQPMEEICKILDMHDTWLHTDAAQGFGKDLAPLRNRRLDLISVSGHKIYGPKGIGALIARKRGYKRPPLKPLMVGGGQERGLRPGTLPVALIAAFGKAAEMAVTNHDQRLKRYKEIRQRCLESLHSLDPVISGDVTRTLPHVLNLRFGKLDSEALMVSLKDLVAISNGSACTSSSYTTSHVLQAMGISEEDANRCIRISWCHLTPDVDWEALVKRIETLL